MAFTAEQETYLQQIMGERKLSRKSAVQYARRNGFPITTTVPESIQQAAQAHETAEQVIGDVPQSGTTTGRITAEERDAAGNAPTVVVLDEVQNVCPAQQAAVLASPAPETAPPAPQAAMTTPVDAPAGETPKQTGKKGRKGKVEAFDSAKAVELYRAGTKVVDIAVALGYERGTGQNRVRIALMAAGVYKDTPKK